MTDEIKTKATYYKDFTAHKSIFGAVKNSEIVAMKLEEKDNDKQLLWFYLKGIGKFNVPLVVKADIKIEQLIDTFMRG